MDEKLKRETQFSANYAEIYDQFSDIVNRGYETSSRVMANRIVEYKPDAKIILEIGSGTGNSALAMLETLPSVEKIIGVEKTDFIWFANAKRGNKISDMLGPTQASAYSKETERRWQQQKGRFELVQSDGEALPFANESMDAVFMSQVFHWLEPNKALDEICRVLKPGGILAFDESEYHFDFGATEEGRRIKVLNVWNHPFAVMFKEHFSEELRARGIELKEIPFVPPSTYLFNLNSLRKLLEQHGFELLPDLHNNPYTTTHIPVARDKVVQLIESGAPMMMKPEILRNFESKAQADEILATALKKARDEWDETLEDSGAEFGPTDAEFIARKISPAHVK